MAWKGNLYPQTALAGTPYLDPRTVDMLTEVARVERDRLATGLFLTLDGTLANAVKRVVFQRHPDMPDQGSTPMLVLQIVGMNRSALLNPQFSMLLQKYSLSGADKHVTVRRPRMYDVTIQATLWEKDEFPPMQLLTRLNALMSEQFVYVLGQKILIQNDAPVHPGFEANKSHVLGSMGRYQWRGVPIWHTGTTLKTGKPLVGALIEELSLDMQNEHSYDDLEPEV